MATRMPYWKQLLVSGSTAVSLSAAAAAALSAIMPEQRPSEALLSAASAEIGAAAYVDTFSTRLGQRTAREKLAAHDGDGLARLFFECTAFAPEAFFLRQFGHRFAAHNKCASRRDAGQVDCRRALDPEDTVMQHLIRAGTLCAAALLLSRPALGHGMWGHIQVTGWAVENMPDDESPRDRWSERFVWFVCV